MPNKNVQLYKNKFLKVFGQILINILKTLSIYCMMIQEISCKKCNCKLQLKFIVYIINTKKQSDTVMSTKEALFLQGKGLVTGKFILPEQAY